MCAIVSPQNEDSLYSAKAMTQNAALGVKVPITVDNFTLAH